MSIFDKLLAGERVSVVENDSCFELTYGPQHDGKLITYMNGNAVSILPMSEHVAREYVDERERRFGMREVVAAPKAQILFRGELVLNTKVEPVAEVKSEKKAPAKAETKIEPVAKESRVSKIKKAFSKKAK